MDTKEITNYLQEQYPDAGIRSVEVDEGTGKSTFYLNPTKKSLAFIEDKKGGGITPKIGGRSSSSVINRDYISGDGLDLYTKSAYEEEYSASFKRAIKYYYTDPLVGSTTNILASLARKGFENDIDDPNIKEFFDSWVFDVGFEDVLEWIFLDFFKVGHVTTYKVVSNYKPGINYFSKSNFDESAARKKRWSKNHLPVAYTVLNPLLVEVSGNLLFDNTEVKLQLPDELKNIIKKAPSELTDGEKDFVKKLPADLKKAAKNNESYSLDKDLVGSITYRKQPYERYAKPRTSRVFDAIEYKKKLEQADLSTLDGISNYILKITVGNNEYPVVNQKELETVAKLFNTPSKSFDVVWNHTLDIEKIVSPEIEAILGEGKYHQVNNDMTTGLAITRALIDGGSDVSEGEVSLLVKGILEEVNYARRQVTKWIYNEYQQIAKAAGFKKIPKIRWDDGILVDTILYMNTLGQLVDRRMLSYKTALESLGFDYDNELSNMKSEVKLVKNGIFGIIGSPWQQSRENPVETKSPNSPSSGRPPGKNTKKTPTTDPSKLPKQKPSQVKQNKKVNGQIISSMSEEEYISFLNGASKVLSGNEFNSFFKETMKYRINKDN